jgi:hypothetical protein
MEIADASGWGAAEWDAAIRAICEGLHAQTGAGAVMITVFAAPWMKEENGFVGSATGIAGTRGIDPLRIARELRETAQVLEEQAANLAAGKPFEVNKEWPTQGGN